MTTAGAYKTAQQEVLSILEGAGLIDGEKATASQASSKVLFWDTVLKTKEASDKQTYLVWELVSLNGRGKADNRICNREAYVVFDIFTKRSKTSKQVQVLIKSIEDKAIGAGWQFEYSGPAEYERETALYHISFNLFKIF